VCSDRYHSNAVQGFWTLWIMTMSALDFHVILDGQFACNLRDAVHRRYLQSVQH
jgi:hypothetical protein